jgi:hypothetical protein
VLGVIEPASSLRVVKNDMLFDISWPKPRHHGYRVCMKPMFKT